MTSLATQARAAFCAGSIAVAASAARLNVTLV